MTSQARSEKVRSASLIADDGEIQSDDGLLQPEEPILSRSQLGDHDQAISWLRQGAEEHYPWMTVIDTLLVFDPLRSDPPLPSIDSSYNESAKLLTSRSVAKKTSGMAARQMRSPA